MVSVIHLVYLQMISAQKQDQKLVGQTLLMVPFMTISLFLFMLYLFCQSFSSMSMYEADRKESIDKNFTRQIWVLERKFCLWDGKTLLELQVLAHKGGLFLLLSRQRSKWALVRKPCCMVRTSKGCRVWESPSWVLRHQWKLQGASLVLYLQEDPGRSQWLQAFRALIQRTLLTALSWQSLGAGVNPVPWHRR